MTAAKTGNTLKRLLSALLTALLILSALPTALAVKSDYTYSLIKRNATGDEVYELQWALSDLGFSGTLTVDGTMSADWVSVLKQFQRRNGLTADGIAGQDVQSLIYEGKPKNASGDAMEISVLPPFDNIQIEKNDKGQPVRHMQARLTELGYYVGEANGICDDATVEAVKHFQKSNSLQADGKAGEKTLTRLYSQDAVRGIPTGPVAVNPVATYTPVPDPTVFKTPGGTLKSGSRGSDVRLLQQRLVSLGYMSSGVDGSYGENTKNAVIAFQTAQGIDADGIAGPATIRALFADTAATPTPSPSPKPTATPKPTVSVTVAPKYTLKKGSKGDNVLILQNRLKDLGYLTGTCDTYFGAITEAAVRIFQSNNGLDSDGIAGSSTLKLLFSNDALSLTERIETAVPTATPKPTDTSVKYKTLKRGSSGDAVTDMQRRLIVLGFMSTVADGKFGGGTQLAVTAFQKANGLKADGIAGQSTLTLLYSDSAQTDEGTSITETIGNAYTLRLGDSGALVTAAQKKLIALGYITGTANGAFDNAMKAAVTAFQKQNRLTQDGVIGENTLKALNSTTAATAPPAPVVTATPGPSATVSTASVIRFGDKGDNVKSMQNRLIQLGYLASGSADGQYGNNTYQAVVAFQKNNSLKTDGIVGAETLKKLNSSAVIGAGTGTGTGTGSLTIDPSKVEYVLWYSMRSNYKVGQYVTIYDYQTGTSFRLRFSSLGKHADSEPVTAADTEAMNKAFGKVAWTPHPVWVVMPDGRICIATMHNVPHLYGTIKTNNFDGHLCVHFPRTQAQVESIGPYATKHQKAVDEAWALLQSTLGK
ncbi:MAG: peptidoglycan-binding protein [Eubacteriales bacterium]|nr:peptidoglycan-binding protein [Eubacteriales bacterium]MDD3882816.1 peptidoglycan-binding protein [Eubacteriales bacterium]MDD4513286.1 peptidoglycan-binding protein [Eubacteriales bacterium]